MLFSILLTIPHYTCLGKNKQHTCDVKAYLLAESISEKVSEVNNKIKFHTKIILGNINRTKLDLNRSASRETSFRRGIREEVERSERVIILDCHSFDENHDFFEKHKNPDFVLITDNYERFKKQVHLLRDILENNGIKTNIIQGIENDIIDEFENNQKVIIPLLLEVSENIKTNKMNIISDSIKMWLLKVVKNE